MRTVKVLDPPPPHPPPSWGKGGRVAHAPPGRKSIHSSCLVVVLGIPSLCGGEKNVVQSCHRRAGIFFWSFAQIGGSGKISDNKATGANLQVFRSLTFLAVTIWRSSQGQTRGQQQCSPLRHSESMIVVYLLSIVMSGDECRGGCSGLSKRWNGKGKGRRDQQTGPLPTMRWSD
jgi:hypothetical protein